MQTAHKRLRIGKIGVRQSGMRLLECRAREIDEEWCGPKAHREWVLSAVRAIMSCDPCRKRRLRDVLVAVPTRWA